MKIGLKLGLAMALGLVLVGGTEVTASAASKVKVYSTHKIAKKAYHGRSGYIYTSNKLTKVSHKMKNYKYTTWYATKWSNVKYKGKFSHVTYITAGSKHGWIYSKYLKAGKAPINKQKRLDDTYAAYQRAIMNACPETQSYLSATNTYSNMGALLYGIPFDYLEESVSDTKMDKSAILKVYQVFKGRFSSSQNSNLAAMAKQLDATEVSSSTQEIVQSRMNSLSSVLGNFVMELN